MEEEFKNDGRSEKGAPESNAVDFGNSFKESLSILENKRMSSIIDNFTIQFTEKLSAFIGNKLEVEFNSLKCHQSKLLLGEKKEIILSTFVTTSHSAYGLITLDNFLLSYMIDLLFGYHSSNEENKLCNLGQCSLKIAKKTFEMCLDSLQSSIAELIPFKATLSKSIGSIKNINVQNLPENVYQTVFKISDKGFSGLLSIGLPEDVIDQIVLHNKPVSTQDADNSKEQLKHNVADTTVSIVAMLPEFKLKFNELANLKSGDLIPIGDPTQVELSVGSKKVFKAIVGQENSCRVVKIIEPISKPSN